MSFKGVLKIDSIQFNIVSMDLSFQQSVDETGKPCAKPTGGQVRITLESSDDAPMLMRWMISHDSTKDLTILFSKYELTKPRKLVLEKAFCVGYHEHFSSIGNEAMLVNLTISTQKISCDDAVMEKEWYLAAKK